MVAAAPAWFSNNLTQIAVGTLLVLTVVVVRMVQKLSMRLMLVALIALVGLFVYANRAPLKACAKTCECEIGGRHLTVPACRTDVNL
jgi:hypothetical protein